MDDDYSEDRERLHEELKALSHASREERRTNAIERRALRLHAILMRDWAVSDDGAIPTLDDAFELAAREIDALCEALGDLADRVPSEVFPGGRRGRPLSHD